MSKYALLLAYEGTESCGWQRQDPSYSGNKPSLQQLVEDAVESISGERVPVVASGRTDAGVHAVGQVAHLVLQKKSWSEFKLKEALNARLPGMIRVRQVKTVPDAFHAQKDAIGKTYSYWILQSSSPIPHLARSNWWIRKTLDQEAMREALKALEGEKDFKVFQASGSNAKTTVREIMRAEMQVIPVAFPVTSGASWLCVRLFGKGFLKQMVRSIVGTLILIGEKKVSASVMQHAIETQDRSLLGPTAFAGGLFLEKVHYSPELDLF